MHREWLENGSLRIWLTDTEAQGLGIVFDDDHTTAEGQCCSVKLAISHLLCEAIRERPRLIACSWEVEALPIDGGCLLLCTPYNIRPRRVRGATAQGAAGRTHTASEPRLRSGKERTPFVLHLETVDSLFELARGLRRTGIANMIAHSALYAFGDEYRLILQPENGALPPFFTEYASSFEEGMSAAAAVQEHGKAIAAHHALQKIAVLQSGKSPL